MLSLVKLPNNKCAPTSNKPCDMWEHLMVEMEKVEAEEIKAAETL
jgi:hypothetical protein